MSEMSALVAKVIELEKERDNLKEERDTLKAEKALLEQEISDLYMVHG